ncbi:sugar porter family MFS transporter [Rhodotorula paludigena]|uniref:sugar porter family MFS transporter n=1 Tax=Rhodotorula paludigena TaxID=86838 RepID=UPI0031794CDD
MSSEKPQRPAPASRGSTFLRLQAEVAQEKMTGEKQHFEKRRLEGDGEFVEPGSTSAKNTTAVSKSQALDNPLSGISMDRLEAMGRAFAREKGLEKFETDFAKGAQAAQDPTVYDLPLLSDEDKEILRREVTHKWDQPKTLWFLVICCSAAAAVQGMDESVANGATLFWPVAFGLDTSNGAVNADQHSWLVGLVNGAPYLCCAVLGCWLTAPVNKLLGRRGAMFGATLISFLGCIWSALTSSWPHLFVARLFLGLGIGINSSTVPVFAAETAPPLIRGALVMQWQVWTAFGIMLGTISSLAFLNVGDTANIHGLNWRLMLGSAILPAVFVMSQVWFVPESPRWLMGRGRYVEAFKSLRRLRHSDVQAARDLFAINALLEEEASVSHGKNPVIELFTVARNRRAAQASGIVMFMQQFCGINVIAYYSSVIFKQAGFSETSALGASIGFGALNFLGALPAFFTIDKFGRRTLLLISFPCMAIFLLLTGFAFLIPEESKAHIGVVALGIYLHCLAYSPGEGPVPFTYSAEAFPFYVRDVGMSLATATTWLFNFIVALTFPRLLEAFTPTGAFGWYAGWNVIGTILVLCFLPETKGLSLEELDAVFSVPTMTHAKYQLKHTVYAFRKYILRQQLAPYPPLYAWDVQA